MVPPQRAREFSVAPAKTKASKDQSDAAVLSSAVVVSISGVSPEKREARFCIDTRAQQTSTLNNQKQTCVTTDHMLCTPAID